MGEIADDMAHAYGVYDDDHDPMCPIPTSLKECLCALISRVRADEREACIALVETVAQSGAYIDYVEIDSVIAAIRAREEKP